MPFDVFLSHATEDKVAVALPLRKALSEAGISVWIDESEIGLGDSMRLSMEKGLSVSRWGVVIVSPAFLRKYWTQAELDALFAQETVDRKVILPVYYQVTPEDIRRAHPILASRKGVLWSEGLGRVVAAIADVVGSAAGAFTAPASSGDTRPAPGNKVVMVLSPSGKSFFVECARMESSGTTELVLEPGESQRGALVTSLREKGERPVAVAFDLRMFLGRQRGLKEEFGGGRHTVTLSLVEDDHAYGDPFMRDMAFNSLSADEVAEMRARRILFDETLKGRTAADDPFLEVLVRGMGVPLPVPSSPFPGLFRDFEGHAEAFLVGARLVGVLWLHLSCVVDEITTLDLSMEDPRAMAVHFEGRRPKRFVNSEPHMIRLDGICKLDTPKANPS